MTKLTLTEQEELFAKDCKLINLRYEYTNYTGKEKWAVVTELTEKKLRKKYPDIIKRYTPFVLLSKTSKAFVKSVVCFLTNQPCPIMISS